MSPTPYLMGWLFLWAATAFAAGFTNPLLPRGQDPSAVFHDGRWWLLQSDGSLFLRSATHLAGLESAPKSEVWPKQCCGVWAPELVRVRDRWWIYYARDEGQNESHRMYSLAGTGDSPAGPYLDRGRLFDPAADRWAIDGAAFEFRGELYFVWSGWPGATNGQQNLYVAPMSDPATLSGPRRLLAEPTEAWERHGLPIMEGPQPLIRGDRLFLVYSASGSWTDDYCLGLLEFVGPEVLDRNSWKKHPAPVFAHATGSWGPGHNSPVLGPRGQWWNLYHAIDEPGGGWRRRSLRAQPFTWSEAGLPEFGTPLAPGTAVSDSEAPRPTPP